MKTADFQKPYPTKLDGLGNTLRYTGSPSDFFLVPPNPSRRQLIVFNAGDDNIILYSTERHLMGYVAPGQPFTVDTTGGMFLAKSNALTTTAIPFYVMEVLYDDAAAR